MKYTMKSHPTLYKGTMFRSRLEARYAAYFDLCGFKWEYEPIDLDGWTPDFKVVVICGAGDYDPCCYMWHTFWVEIKPYERASQFSGHAFERFNKPYEFSAVGLGLTPEVETKSEMSHGAGEPYQGQGGVYGLSHWVITPMNSPGGRPDLSCGIAALWAEAGNITRYHPRQKTKPTPNKVYKDIGIDAHIDKLGEDVVAQIVREMQPAPAQGMQS
jgi:hypothetical protein